MKVCISVVIGCGKGECEDTAIFNETLVNNQIMCIDDDHLRCVGVADGVGGNAGGRIASRYIVYQFSQKEFRHLTEDEIRQFANNINSDLIKHAITIPEKAEMATTLTCVVATDDGYYLVHAGNTRLYVMQGSYLKQLTTDHTTYNWLMECGQYEAAEQCNKSEINCCFGGGNLCYANRLVVEKLFDTDFPNTLVLTSDGVHEFVDVDFIEETLVTSKSDDDAVKLITDKAIQNGSTDDKTIAIIRR
ncbi:MAG: PP2C family protein-serine/threonine phosphatase [Acutalibacteraceae bacterium]